MDKNLQMKSNLYINATIFKYKAQILKLRCYNLYVAFSEVNINRKAYKKISQDRLVSALWKVSLWE